LNDNFKEQKNAQANQPIFLYSIIDYDSLGNDLNFAEYESDVKYPTDGGTLYTRFPIKHEYTSQNVKGSIDQVTLTVANVNRLIEAYLLSYNLRGKQVKIKHVWAYQLADEDAYTEEIYYIDNYTTDVENAVFVLSSKFDVLDVTLPTRTYLRSYCAWKFGSTQCGHTIVGDETCNKTFARCRVLANQIRFGGFPSVPSDKLFAG
jgi:lambda family phage minor tail protein L